VFENRVFRRIFGPNRGEVTGECGKLNNEEFNDLYCSPNIDRVIQSRRMRWARYIARMREKIAVYRVQGNLKEEDHLGDPNVDGRVILSWILKK